MIYGSQFYQNIIWPWLNHIQPQNYFDTLNDENIWQFLNIFGHESASKYCAAKRSLLNPADAHLMEDGPNFTSFYL